MKKISKFFLGLAAVAMMSACSDDLGTEPNQPGVGGDVSEITDPVYLSVNFQMPSVGGASRSFTDDDDASNNGTEPGTDAENNVNEVLLILARPNDYGLIASAVVQNADITKNSAQNPIYRATTKFSKTTFNLYYNDNLVPPQKKGEVAVFVVVNPNDAINKALNAKTYGNQDWAQAIGEVTEGNGAQISGSIWDDNKFLMSNQLICLRSIPPTIDGWNPYSEGSKIFHLSDINGVAGAVAEIDNSANSGKGAIKVERVAARFDFRDGSEFGNNKYHVMYLRNDDGTVNKDKPFCRHSAQQDRSY